VKYFGTQHDPIDGEPKTPRSSDWVHRKRQKKIGWDQIKKAIKLDGCCVIIV
jgi:hypothetical protein